MKKVIIILSFAALLSSCGSEYTAVDKYGDAEQKYEYAKECFAIGKFQNHRSRRCAETLTVLFGSHLQKAY